MERLARYAEDARDRVKCRQCGHPVTECMDAHRDWFPQRTVCYSTMALNEANRRYDDLHKDAPYHDGSFGLWAKERTPDQPFHYKDGVTIWVAATDFTPHDHFLGGIDDCDVCSPSE